MRTRFLERFVYCVFCCLSLGFFYAVKLAVKMAIVEANNSKEIK